LKFKHLLLLLEILFNLETSSPQVRGLISKFLSGMDVTESLCLVYI